jgi:3',5'-cyclic AMP phosphodiesterase CpdA
MSGATLWAISDLHVGHSANRAIVDRLRPDSPDDWLIVAGDVAEHFDVVRATLASLRERYATVVWAPGNHELWTHPSDPVTLRGVARYDGLVQACRDIGVLTPEDPYPAFTGVGGPVTIAPLFLLYDYSFRAPGTTDTASSLRYAYRTGIVCTDEFLLHPDPFATRAEWCWARVAETERRLAARDPDLPTVLVNHHPLVREPTRILRHPEFAQWCGTDRTDDWPVRFRAAMVVYGHLHIPRTITQDGVPHVEVSVGYPREWRRRGPNPPTATRITPTQSTSEG